MAGWRAAGLKYVILPKNNSNFQKGSYITYINYSTIAAKLLRKALKIELQTNAMKRDTSQIKFTKWVDGIAQKLPKTAA